MSDIVEWKKIRNCVPFIDNGVGVEETQAAMDEMLAEIARLTECIRVAGLQCFIAEGTPEDIAAHMASVVKSHRSEIGRITDQADRLAGGIDLITDERNQLAKRVADLESYLRLIETRCDIPAKPGQVCHHNPAEIARQALGGGA